MKSVKKAILVVLGCLLAISQGVYAQSQRITDYNLIGWYVYNGDHSLSKKWEVHTEYQWRRINLIRTWQQSLARLGLVYKIHDKVAVAFGYTYFITYPYGAYPVADLGKPTPEHRLYQDLQWEDSGSRITLSHRIRVEQRWLSELSKENPRKITAWEFQNRIRYQLQMQLPLKGTTLDNKELYLTFFDELFIGFGKNVQNNIFNQNRILGGIGYQLTKDFQIELGYLNQITQHAENDPRTGKKIFESNNGFRLNINYNFSFKGN